MIIVSQDKTDIINFDNIGWLYVEPNDNSVYVALVGGATIIGTYKTEKRAKEVLQEIVNKYRQFNLDNNQTITLNPKVYEMPKE